MCRFVSFLGKRSMLMSQLIEKPENSLIKQSRCAKEGLHGINADGFGLAWYCHDIDPLPGVFKSTQPAWNDNNLRHIANKTQSSCFLAHIRASTVGDVNLSNCHPFSYKQFSFVHNGTIRGFNKIKRQLISLLEDELLFQIKGCTDSEYLFFLIMHFLNKTHDSNLEQAVTQAFHWVSEAQEACSDDFSRLNIVISDGKKMIATRFVNKGMDPLSVNYLLTNIRHPLEENPSNKKASCIIIASEPLTDYENNWSIIKTNHYLTVSSDTLEVDIKPF